MEALGLVILWLLWTALRLSFMAAVLVVFLVVFDWVFPGDRCRSK